MLFAGLEVLAGALVVLLGVRLGLVLVTSAARHGWGSTASVRGRRPVRASYQQAVRGALPFVAVGFVCFRSYSRRVDAVAGGRTAGWTVIGVAA